jgi:acid stress chaperone HdeB
MRSMLLSSSVMLAVAVVPAVAQVTVDVGRISCEQYTAFKVADPRDIAIWMSGYYHGKRGNTVLETQALAEQARKLQDYCIHNPQVQVMQAVETLFGAAK